MGCSTMIENFVFLLTSAGRFVPSSSPLPLFLHLSERNSEMSSMTSRPVSLSNSRGAAALIPYLQAREPCPTKRKRFVRMGETNRKDRSDTIRRSRNYFAEKLGSLRRRIKWVAARVHSLCQIRDFFKTASSTQTIQRQIGDAQNIGLLAELLRTPSA